MFQPIQIGSLGLKNRLVMAPMGTNFGDASGCVSEEARRYYARRAAGGVGLILTEAMYVHISGAHRAGAIGIDRDERIPELRTLTDAVHKRGGKIAAQLTHAGRVVGGAVRGEGYPQAWGPSALTHRKTGERSHAMTEEEIRLIVRAFGDAAARARKSGFDAVEIHGTHGYLLMQFMSPLWNRRKDSYGGSLENRMRFPLEVARQVLASAGGRPVIYRIGGSELLPGGMSPEDAQTLAAELERVGVSALHVSGGINETPADMKNSIGTNYAPEGYFVDLAADIRRKVSIPVIAVGRLGNPELAASVLAEGKADLVCLGRSLLADPEWPEKVRQGREAELVRCISCNRGCIEELCRQRSITCVQNPALGHETDAVEPPRQKKRILVAGAGLAGLEFAVQAAARGHAVEVWEAADAAGGQVELAARPPHKEDFRQLISSRLKKLEKLQVPVCWNRRVTAEDGRSFDLVAVCTGAVPKVPPVPWRDEPIVCDAFSLLRKKCGLPEAGDKAVVVGGGAVGLETAHLLADRGAHVWVVDVQPKLGNGFVPTAWAAFLESCASLHIEFCTSSCVKRVFGRTVILERQKCEEVLEGVSMVVTAIGSEPDAALEKSLRQAGVSYIVLGSCAGAVDTLGTVRQAYEQGTRI